MRAKPRHLSIEYAEQFKDISVVEAYDSRPTYPQETFEILGGLIGDESRAVLDIGCGTGFIARNTVAFAERIDAVDFSKNMIEKAKSLPAGDDPKINWICSPVEEASLNPPYGLVVAGDSLHWMDWYVVLPRLKKALTPGGYLAIVSTGPISPEWSAHLQQIISRYSTNHDYQPYNLVEELEGRGLFRKSGHRLTSAVPFRQSLEEYIESFHARNGFSRERMSKESADSFDSELRLLISEFSNAGVVSIKVVGEVTWGKPT